MTLSQFGKFNKRPFNFILPDELPPSLPPVGDHYSSHPYIEYLIRVVLELSKWHRSNIRYSIPITIYPHIHLHNDLYRPINIENENRKHVHLDVTLSEGVILPAIPFTIHYNLHNPSRSIVEEIIVELYQNRYMGKRGNYRSLVFEVNVLDGNEFNGEDLHDNFQLTLPSQYLPPTSSFTFDHQSKLTQFNPTSINYELIIKANMTGLFTDFSSECPIIMGIQLTDRSPPPSYASVMKLH
jgi:hypothetical protein